MTALETYFQVGIYPGVLNEESGELDDSSLPLEILCIEAADGDPLRAQEIFDGVNRHFWKWWVVYRKALSAARPKR